MRVSRAQSSTREVAMRTFMTVSALAALVAAAPCADAQNAAGSVGPPLAISIRSLTLHQDMRRLWADHVVWTRMYIIGVTSEDGSAQVALDRLMRNQEEIGNAIKPFYGEAAAAQLTTLLKQHIDLSGEVLAAAKAGDAATQADADRRWHENAAAIATLLSTANPDWPRQSVQDMLYKHLALTTQEAIDRLHKNWADDQVTFDTVFSHAMDMADTLSDGIIKQFPSRA